MEPTSRTPRPEARAPERDDERIPSELADEVMARAARLHARSRAMVSRDELASIAQEVDIPAEYVAEAFEQVRAEHETAKKRNPGDWYTLGALASLVGACYLVGWFRADSPIGLHRAWLPVQVGAFLVLALVIWVVLIFITDALLGTEQPDGPEGGRRA